MSKGTRRAFITTGVVAGGGVMGGIAIRPGNQIKDLVPKLGIDGENLVHTYIKIDTDNNITPVIETDFTSLDKLASINVLLKDKKYEFIN